MRTMGYFVIFTFILLYAKEGDRTMDNNNLKSKLSPLQYKVTQECGTEPPFNNEYWNNKRSGIYVDIVSGEPLFSSMDKFESGSGWPSFTRPLGKKSVVERTDENHGLLRTEVRSVKGDSHLGHVFDDGPAPTGQRYCINSAALRFIPAGDLEKEGYGEYVKLFKQTSPGNASPGKRYESATFAAGCFWGVEALFKTLKGVVETTVGYTGGTVADPTYRMVCSNTTGHAEAVKVIFDPKIVSYDRLVDFFWEMHDPTTHNRQGPDYGTQYRSAIFYHNEEQKRAALASKERAEASHRYKRKIVTEIVPAVAFYEAEEYHQDYFDKHPEKASCHIPGER